MNDIVNGIMNAIGNGGWIDVLSTLASDSKDVGDAINAILHLIGTLSGG